MVDTPECLGPEFLHRIAMLRDRLDDMTSDLLALAQAIGAVEARHTWQARRSVQGAAEQVQHAVDELDSAEIAAGLANDFSGR